MKPMTKKPPHEIPALPRRLYRAPKLIAYGAMKNLTASGTASPREFFNDPNPGIRRA